MARPILQSPDRVLLVEGQDDKQVVRFSDEVICSTWLLGSGHLAHENIVGSVNAAFGFGVKHAYSQHCAPVTYRVTVTSQTRTHRALPV